jgi:hypothetical protein
VQFRRPREAALRQGVHVVLHLLNGDVADRLVEFLGHDKPDLVVMGLIDARQTSHGFGARFTKSHKRLHAAFSEFTECGLKACAAREQTIESR